MKRIALAALVALGLCTSSSRAETLPLILDTPAEYLPGTPFTFEVRAPGVVDFTAYSIELVFETGPGNPPLLLSAAPVAGQYPFPTLSNFQAVPGSFAGSTTLTLTDSTAPPGVLTTPGTNDLIAVVSVTPGAGFTGSITISVNPSTLSFDLNSEATPSIEAPEPITVTQGTPPPQAVPTPAAWLSLGIGGLLLAARRRVLRKT